MNNRTKDIGTVIDYHKRTEHQLPDRFAASLGYMDWENQPVPFRFYDGTERIHLPLCEPAQEASPSWESIRPNTPDVPKELNIKTLSQLLYDSLAISAWKQAGHSKWPLRCNPSSGNLHPTEAYILLNAMNGVATKPALLHYLPMNHSIEVIRRIEPNAFENLSSQFTPNAFVIGLSTIIWREAWKYGERAFRYCMHDVGHAIGAISCAARILGWRVRRVEGLNATQLDRLLALDTSVGPEAEHADVLLAVEPCPSETDGAVQLDLPGPLMDGLCPPCKVTPNTLSPEHEDWPVLGVIEKATRDRGLPHGDIETERITITIESNTTSPRSSPLAREIVRGRRSAVDFDGQNGMNRDQLYRMLYTLVPKLTPSLWSVFPHRQRVHPVVFLHRIDGLEPGLAILVRNPSDEAALRAAITNTKGWGKLPGCPDELPLYRLRSGDMRQVGRAIHCHQDIGADGALVVSMIGAFDAELQRFGAPAWRYLHWEAGAVGHLLYLEAEALKLSATGIGCFFDQAVHKILGLEGEQFRMLYGTAVGKAVNDSRIQTLSAYDG